MVSLRVMTSTGMTQKFVTSRKIWMMMSVVDTVDVNRTVFKSSTTRKYWCQSCASLRSAKVNYLQFLYPQTELGTAGQDSNLWRLRKWQLSGTCNIKQSFFSVIHLVTSRISISDSQVFIQRHVLFKLNAKMGNRYNFKMPIVLCKQQKSLTIYRDLPT